MSWQEEYNKRYEARLAENWMPDGSRLSAYWLNLQQHEKAWVQPSISEAYKDTLGWGPMTVNQNTREICGND